MQRRRIALFFAIAILGAAADLATKAWAEVRLEGDRAGIAVIPGLLSFQYGTNTGAAFGMFKETTWGPPLLTVISIAAAGLIVYLAIRFRDGPILTPVALGLVLGGVVGNVYDRLANDWQVRDFILVYYKGWAWPIFNLADSYITLGVLLLLVFSPWKQVEGKKKEASPASPQAR